jgi:hypothetical protein
MAKREKRVPESEHRRVCIERDQLLKVLADITTGEQPACTRVWRHEGERVTWRLFRVLGADGGLVFERRDWGANRTLRVISLDDLVAGYSGSFAGEAVTACTALGDLLRARDQAFEQEKQAHKLLDRASGV